MTVLLLIFSFDIIILLKSYYNFSKQMFKAAKKTFSEKIGIKGKNKNRDPDAFDSINDMSRFPSEDHLEVGITKLKNTEKSVQELGDRLK